MKIKKGGKYEKPLNGIIEILEEVENIKVKDLKDTIKNKYNSNEETIEELIFYLISKENIIVIDDSKRFNNQKIKLIKKPELQFEDLDEDEYPKMVLTLPPFDKFGLKSELNITSKKSSLKTSFKELFSKASSEICICSPFLEFTGIEPFLQTLLTKANEGVDIKILSRQIKKDDPNSRYEQMYKLKKTFNENNYDVDIRNYYYRHKNKLVSSTHAKIIIIDQKYAYLGSGELRQNSFNKNFEVGVILKGKQAKKLGKLFNYMFEVSEKI